MAIGDRSQLDALVSGLRVVCSAVFTLTTIAGMIAIPARFYLGFLVRATLAGASQEADRAQEEVAIDAELHTRSGAGRRTATAIGGS